MSARPPFAPPGAPPAGARQSPAAAALQSAAGQAHRGDDRLAAVLQEVRSRLTAQLSPAQIDDPSDADLHTAEAIIKPLVEAMLHQARAAGEPVAEPAVVVAELMDKIFGYGPLTPYLADEGVEEIIINGPYQVFIIHAQRGKELTGARFRDTQELRSLVQRLARGREFNRANPKVDARMRDGSRLHAIMEPLAVNVPVAVTIRRHRLVARTLADLVTLGSLTPPAAEFLRLAVRARLNLVIAGGTASGKTNFLNALGNEAQSDDRFVIVEDTPEIQIDKPDVVQMTTRDQAESAKAFSIADLVIEALRMRPDRIITGEARGAEIVDVLSAANTGHDGQMLTIHANSSRDVIQRMETMYLMKGVEVPTAAILRQIADAFQLIVYLKRVTVGGVPRRFVTEIAEIAPSRQMEEGKVIVQNILADSGHGLRFAGYFPRFAAELMNERGVPLTQGFFRT